MENKDFKEQIICNRLNKMFIKMSKEEETLDRKKSIALDDLIQKRDQLINEFTAEDVEITVNLRSMIGPLKNKSYKGSSLDPWILREIYHSAVYHILKNLREYDKVLEKLDEDHFEFESFDRRKYKI